MRIRVISDCQPANNELQRIDCSSNSAYETFALACPCSVPWPFLSACEDEPPVHPTRHPSRYPRRRRAEYPPQPQPYENGPTPPPTETREAPPRKPAAHRSGETNQRRHPLRHSRSEQAWLCHQPVRAQSRLRGRPRVSSWNRSQGSVHEQDLPCSLIAALGLRRARKSRFGCSVAQTACVAALDKPADYPMLSVARGPSAVSAMLEPN